MLRLISTLGEATCIYRRFRVKYVDAQLLCSRTDLSKFPRPILSCRIISSLMILVEPLGIRERVTLTHTHTQPRIIEIRGNNLKISKPARETNTRESLKIDWRTPGDALPLSIFLPQHPIAIYRCASYAVPARSILLGRDGIFSIAFGVRLFLQLENGCVNQMWRFNPPCESSLLYRAATFIKSPKKGG